MKLEPDDPGASTAASLLRIDLDAVARNYRLLKSKLGAARCAAAVKADAYGLGIARVAPVLVSEGCSTFFVATIDEGIEILTGVAAGTRDTNGAFPAESINGMVEARLHKLADQRRAFARSGKNDNAEDAKDA